MNPRVKICGITNLEDALLAERLGADALGFIFYPQSPRSISPATAAAIARALHPFTNTVGVFVNESVEDVNRITMECRLDKIQLHGDEPFEMLAALARPAYRAFRVQSEADLERINTLADQVLLLDPHHPEHYGGTGRKLDWAMARKAAQVRPIILAGSLSPENVVEAVETVRPYSVDASSSLEISPGKKDPARLQAYFQALANLPHDITPLKDADEYRIHQG